MRRLLAVAAAGVVLQVAHPAEGEGQAGLNPDHPGHALYQRYCAGCHGVLADGKGSRTANAAKAAPDLTRMQARLGEPLTVEKLVRVIDGRRGLRAHPSSEMPVWGRDLLSEVPDWDQRERARIQLIQSLADYVVSIQRRE